MTDSVDKARSQGWVPLEEWEGAGKEKADWVDHGEFNFRGELMGRISSQTREIKELMGQQQSAASGYENKLKKLGEAVNMLSDQNRKLAKDRIKEERTDLRRIRAEAEAENDHDTMASVDEDLEQLKEAEAALNVEPESPDDEVGQAPQEMSPEDTNTLREWVEQNPWYATHADAARYADFVGSTIPKEGKSFSQYLTEVSEAVSNVFTIEQEPSAGTTPASRVLEPGANGGKGNKRTTSGVANLTETERVIGQTFVEDGVFKSLEEYAKHLTED